MEFDLVIIGASFAGLAAAKTAASRGLSVAVVEAKREPGARIHTSGILVREAIEEIDIPHRLTRRVPGVRLYAPSLESIDLFSPGYAFFTTETAALIRWMTAEARAAGAHVMAATRFTGARRANGRIHLDDIGISTRFLIGADGARSRVASAFGLSENRRFLTGVEIEFEADGSLDPRFLHCFADSRLAPGYIAWAAPAPSVVQVGLAVRDGSKPDLAAFLSHTEAKFGWSRMRRVERRSGLIPCGGPLSRTAAPGVLLVGDAAGWVSPATGGGIRLAFKFGRQAASLVADHLLNGGAPPEIALGRALPAFRAKRALRTLLDLAPPNVLIDLALATAPMRRVAERLYFHRRNDAGIDREAYLRWIETQMPSQPAVARHGDAH
ncbi:MAG TPA: NAD(P)/FAD-dependent oxidoreductase [Bauldia sp.]|nr:NAD(P)/FAD-dependent oxidoreductase [Bauldia sp.]